MFYSDGNLDLDNVIELDDNLSRKISGRKSKSQITVSDLTGNFDFKYQNC